MTAIASTPLTIVRAGKRSKKLKRICLYVFLTVIAAIWLFPVLYAVYTALRPYDDTAKHGYVSIAHKLSFDNFTNAYKNAQFSKYYINSFIITIPAVIITLFLSSMVAFVVSRFSFKLNIALLMLFTAGNLLPPQIILTPLYYMFLRLPLPTWISENGLFYDSHFGIIVIHVAFQIGFCSFVLSNYMKTIPKELGEAAVVDGAGVWLQFRKLILPLCRPAFGALATLEFTWIYNDFLWALLLFKTGDKRPITAALNNLSGQFFTDTNLVAAGSLLAAIPTIVVFILLQKQFVGGLTLGASKG